MDLIKKVTIKIINYFNKKVSEALSRQKLVRFLHAEKLNGDSAVKPTGAGIGGRKWRKLTIGLKILLLIWSLVPSE